MSPKFREGDGDVGVDTDDRPRDKGKRHTSSTIKTDRTDRRDSRDHRNSLPSPSSVSSLRSSNLSAQRKPSSGTATRSSKTRPARESEVVYSSPSSPSHRHRQRHHHHHHRERSETESATGGTGGGASSSSNIGHKKAPRLSSPTRMPSTSSRRGAVKEGREGKDSSGSTVSEKGQPVDRERRRRAKTSSRASPAFSSPDIDPDPDFDPGIDPDPYPSKGKSRSASRSASVVDLIPEMIRSRERLPYPSVNKAFSRESVMSREDLTAPSRVSAGSPAAGISPVRRTGSKRHGDPLTPDTTDLGIGAGANADSARKPAMPRDTAGGGPDRLSSAPPSKPSSRRSSRARHPENRPPSPPDTNASSPKKGHARRGTEDGDRDVDEGCEHKSTAAASPSVADSERNGATSSTNAGGTKTPEPSSTVASSKSPLSVHSMASSQTTYKADERQRETGSLLEKTRGNTHGSQAASQLLGRMRRQPRAGASDLDFSPESAQESPSPKTPTPEASPNFCAGDDWKKNLASSPQPPPPPPAHPHPHLQFLSERFGETAPKTTPVAAAAAVALDRLSATPSPAPGSRHDSEHSATTSQTDDDDAANPNASSASFTSAFASSPPPPPPPPPPLMIAEVPRIDYLMQNGGLPQSIPKSFLAVLPRQQNSSANALRAVTAPPQGPELVFAPFFNLLNQYQTVLQNHGSVAVATGHRTVARRLLDRLENVFYRELPPEGCSCIVCESGNEYHRGLGWGEVLERVSGRIDLPTWPPLNIAALEMRLDAAAVAAAAVGGGAGAAAGLPVRPASPVKIDPDIAEEFREHYLRQNKKVRASVDRWMRDCAEAPASAPQEIDDETLAFAILTSLEQDDRPLFNALLSGSRELQPAIRAPTPMRKPRQDFIVKTGLAIQRLYRLATAPRDAETALYLVKNPEVHDLLHTIAHIHPPEWEILTSGRFDGFLWSGADEDDVSTPVAGEPSGFFPPASGLPISRGPTPASGIGASVSRGPTPSSFLNMSRNGTPASFASGYSAATTSTNATRQAVSTDEEAEIAALAEVEREIYLGMEALEDAFEELDRQAQAVRTALRERSAGLSMRLRRRNVGEGAFGAFGSGAIGGGGGGAGPMRDNSIDVLPQLSGGGGGPSGMGFGRPAWMMVGGGIGTPGPYTGNHPQDFSFEPVSESEWDTSDDFFELKPEDSASNISSSQRRRPKRRSERRTPAPIEEEEES